MRRVPRLGKPAGEDVDFGQYYRFVRTTIVIFVSFASYCVIKLVPNILMDENGVPSRWPVKSVPKLR